MGGSGIYDPYGIYSVTNIQQLMQITHFFRFLPVQVG